MQWTIPGTVLTGQREDAAQISTNFQSMFLGGGIMLSQVTSITGLEPYDVQNWVKRRLLPPPNGKRYDLNQLCRIININMLKKVLHLHPPYPAVHGFAGGKSSSRTRRILHGYRQCRFFSGRILLRLVSGVALRPLCSA